MQHHVFVDSLALGPLGLIQMRFPIDTKVSVVRLVIIDQPQEQIRSLCWPFPTGTKTANVNPCALVHKGGRESAFSLTLVHSDAYGPLFLLFLAVWAGFATQSHFLRPLSEQGLQGRGMRHGLNGRREGFLVDGLKRKRFHGGHLQLIHLKRVMFFAR